MSNQTCSAVVNDRRKKKKKALEYQRWTVVPLGLLAEPPIYVMCFNRIPMVLQCSHVSQCMHMSGYFNCSIVKPGSTQRHHSILNPGYMPAVMSTWAWHHKLSNHRCVTCDDSLKPPCSRLLLSNTKSPHLQLIFVEERPNKHKMYDFIWWIRANMRYYN